MTTFMGTTATTKATTSREDGRVGSMPPRSRPCAPTERAAVATEMRGTEKLLLILHEHGGRDWQDKRQVMPPYKYERP